MNPDNADGGANNDWIKNVSTGKKLSLKMRNLCLIEIRSYDEFDAQVTVSVLVFYISFLMLSKIYIAKQSFSKKFIYKFNLLGFYVSSILLRIVNTLRLEFKFKNENMEFSWRNQIRTQRLQKFTM